MLGTENAVSVGKCHMQIQEPYSQWTLNSYRERQKMLCMLGKGEVGISLN